MRMNAEAKRLGMTGSHCVNPHGLPAEDQYTTARDLARAGHGHPQRVSAICALFLDRGPEGGKKRNSSHNKLIGRFDGADGMKTGLSALGLQYGRLGHPQRPGADIGRARRRSVIGRTEAGAALLDEGLRSRPKAGSTLASLATYGLPGVAPANMREAICEEEAGRAAVRGSARIDGRRRERSRPGS